MAPAVAETIDRPPLVPKQSIQDNSSASTNIFPDGIRTSGQHPPLYDQLRPYSEFPKEIVGPTVWNKEDYDGHPERWTHLFSEEEIAELGKAADDFIVSQTILTGIRKV